MLQDYFFLAFRGLRGRILRTILTMIGIIIGVAAVVSLISLGQGLKDAIGSSFASVGTDKILVQSLSPGFSPPGQDTIGVISEHDVQVIQSVVGVKVVAGRLLKSAIFESGDFSSHVFSASLPVETAARDLVIEANNIVVSQGRMIKPSEAGKILVGEGLWNSERFSRSVVLGSRVKINGVSFEVVGLLKKIGGPRDTIVLLNDDDMRDVFKDSLSVHDELSVIAVQVVSNENVDSVADRISRALRRDRGQKVGFEDFSVTTSIEIIESVNTIVLVVQSIFVGIALISLLVGGIGIMNTMYTSVLEQSRNIGIMKSVGARNGDILWIFLFESGILGLFGGAIGVLVGISLSKMVEFGASGFLGDLLHASFPWYLIVGSLCFSFFVGVLSGIFPARQASIIPPVEALRL